MAKLGARGASVLMTLEKQRVFSEGDLISWERIMYAVRSDGHLLKKRTVRFRETLVTPAAHQCYGWKDMGKKKELLTPAGVEQFKEKSLSLGYIVSVKN